MNLIYFLSLHQYTRYPMEAKEEIVYFLVDILCITGAQQPDNIDPPKFYCEIKLWRVDSVKKYRRAVH